MNNVNAAFVQLDIMSEWVPLSSSMISSLALFQKCFVLPFLSENTIKNNFYFSYLNDKPILRCVVLLIPVIGNITIFLYQFTSSGKNYLRQLTIKRLERYPYNSLSIFFNAGKDFQSHKESVLRALEITKDCRIFAFSAHSFRGDKDFVIRALEITKNDDVFYGANKELKKDAEFIFKAIRIMDNHRLFYSADPGLRDTESFMLQGIRIHPSLILASYKLNLDEDFIVQAARINPDVRKFAGSKKSEMEQEDV